MSVANNPNAHDVEGELTATGWTFFYMAGQVTANACGFNRQRTTHIAIQRLVARAKLQKCNCLEIGDVAMHSFFGIPYVSVSAHFRHIQEGPTFFGKK